MKKVIFDVETTGADKSKDRIIQIGIHMFEDDGKKHRVLLSKSKLYNPEMPISEEAFKTHGISDKMVKKAELFRNDAKKLKTFNSKIEASYSLEPYFNVFKSGVNLSNSDFSGSSNLELS
mgnify:CR=1 FL=1